MSGRRYDIRPRPRNPTMQHTLTNTTRVTRSMTSSSRQLSVFENDVQNASTPTDVYDAKYSGILENLPENEKLVSLSEYTVYSFNDYGLSCNRFFNLIILKQERHLVSAITANEVIPTPVVETLDEKEYEDLYGVAFDGMPEMLMTGEDRGKSSTLKVPPLEAAVMKFTPPASKPFTILFKKLDLNKWVGYQNCSRFRVVRDVNFYSVVPYYLGDDAKMLRINDV